MARPMSERQAEFAVQIARLIFYADSLGYRVTFGDAYRDKRAFGKMGTTVAYGAPRSKHKQRLAVDLNLFVRNEDTGKWEYRADSDSHLELGEYWERIGGVWGGRFRNPDGNHYQAAAA